MAPRDPRTHLATHDVINQPPPICDVNLYTGDEILTSCAMWSGAARHATRLEAFGAEVGTQEAQEWCVQANRNTPEFRPFDRYGQRIDEVTFHPAYHNLMALGLKGGVSGAPWNVKDNGHALHAALFFLMGQADYGVCCPMSMTYAAIPALRQAPGVASDWVPRATTEDYDPRFIPPTEKRAATVGMAMTEKQGGSDVRANTTRATPVGGDLYELTGHKWFCSAPMCDAFLTLAQAEGGLTCFLVPRWRSDGTRNPIEIQRLKDKLGDRSNASSEIEYHGVLATRVGEEGRGVRTIMDMVQLTRYDCVIGSATQMRHAARLAVWHVEGRAAFGRTLIDQPLMRAVLADMALDVEAAVALAFRMGLALDRAADDPKEAALLRIGLPLAKYLVTKRTPAVVVEAMECHGGVGFVEETPLPRLYRQAPLNGIWEGSGNVIALDVMRALVKDPETIDALGSEMDAAEMGREAVSQLLSNRLEERDARALAERTALALAAAVLTRFGPACAADGFIARRIKDQRQTFGAGAAAIDEDALIARLGLRV